MTDEKCMGRLRRWRDAGSTLESHTWAEHRNLGKGVGFLRGLLLKTRHIYVYTINHILNPLLLVGVSLG